MKQLKTTLIVNAISSGAAGLLLIVLAGPAAAIFDVTPRLPFVDTGIFLVLFASFVALVATRPSINPAAVRIVTFMDVLWVVASIVAITALRNIISLTGTIAIGAVAAWVSLMAFLQNRGVKAATAGRLSY